MKGKELSQLIKDERPQQQRQKQVSEDSRDPLHQPGFQSLNFFYVTEKPLRG